jgi:hypothetical protein
MTKSETSFKAFGYHLGAIKPVHLANGFFLSLTGRHFQLEWLNKIAVTTHKKGLVGDYKVETLHKILSLEKPVLSSSIGQTELSQLRYQVNAIAANDNAVYAAFDEYRAYGNDYTLSSPQLLCDLDRKDGYAGFFIYSIFNATRAGQEIISISKQEFESSGDSLSALFMPLLDAPDTANEWENRYEDKLGLLEDERIDRVASLMGPTTECILQLLRTSRSTESHYSFLRQLIIALGGWLILYLIREASRVVGFGGSSIFFADFTGGTSRKCRNRSIHCFSRHREAVYQSFFSSVDSGVVENLDAFKDNGGNIDLKDVERHFQDLSVRIGLVQPRAATVRAKHYEPQADTIRSLCMSVLNPDEGPITLLELAQRLRSSWGIVFGGCNDDVPILAENGIVGLDEDDDLSLNRRCFIERLKSLGLATEPSDGLVLCEINAEGAR